MNIETEAEEILEYLSSMLFENCHPLTRRFEFVPTNPGLYAFRHRVEGLLYIGQSINLKRRFCDGHKALSWAFIDRFDPDDVRIAVKLLPSNKVRQATQLEILMLRATRPRYNSLIK